MGDDSFEYDSTWGQTEAAGVELIRSLADQDIADTIKMGGAPRGYPNMPSSPHIRGDDMLALVGYVRSLSRGADDAGTITIAAE